MVEINVTFVWDKGTESRLSTESSGRSRVNLQDYRNLSSIGFFGIVLVHAISAGQSGSFSLQVQITGANTEPHLYIQMLPLTQNARVHSAKYIDEHNDDTH